MVSTLASSAIAPRARVIVDNDFAGDPDGLFQLAHHVLSTSVTVRLVICSRLPDHMIRDPHRDVVAEGAAAADEVLDLAGSRLRAVAGSRSALSSSSAPSDATAAIIGEALRRDTDTPLYYVAGAGLTELAIAYLTEPEIADRLTLVWIGGHGYDATADEPEFNTSADIAAARAVFDSPIPIWQVPETTYAQCVVSWSALERDIEPLGALGAHLVGRWRSFTRAIERSVGVSLGETVILGDSPLVLLTSLQASLHADPVSSASELRPRRRLDARGQYAEHHPDAPPVRVFTRLDMRLLYSDLTAKLAARAVCRVGHT